jgi:hypothetical protein
MKYSHSIFLFITLIMVAFITTNCKKDQPVKSQKEITALGLTAEVSADSIEKYVKWMEGMGTRWSFADNHRSIAVMIKNKFIHLGYTTTRLDSFWIDRTYNSIRYQQWQYNVVATLTGNVTPDSICIIGGHYDNSISRGTQDPFLLSYGANDNASGVAAAIEIARVMKKNNYIPKNTIRFVAFGAEELGLLGSWDLSGKSVNLGEKIKFMLNNDMIGYEPSSNPATWFVDIMDYENSHPLRNTAQTLGDQYSLLNSINVNTYNKQSDSYPYSVNGYPAIFFFSYSSDPNYHTLNDISANCNFKYCAEVVKISCATLVYGN